MALKRFHHNMVVEVRIVSWLKGLNFDYLQLVEDCLEALDSLAGRDQSYFDWILNLELSLKM